MKKVSPNILCCCCCYCCYFRGGVFVICCPSLYGGCSGLPYLHTYSCPTPICFSPPLHLSLSSPTSFGLSPSSSFPTAADEYQELLPKEEEDLQEVLASHENAIQDSERLMEKLSEELSTLDEVGGPRENC